MIHLCTAKGRDVYHNLNNDGGRLDDIVDLDYKRKELRIAIDGEMTRAKCFWCLKILDCPKSTNLLHYSKTNKKDAL